MEMERDPRVPFDRATERSLDYGQRGYGTDYVPPWEGPYRGVGPRDYQRSDERIREDACDRLAAHGGIDARDIDVEVVQAEVILRGAVPDRRMKRMAEDVVDQVPGVRDVRNELRVGDTPLPSRRTVFAVFTDGDHAEDAVNELRDAGFDRNDISLLARSEREAREAAGSTGAEAKGAGAGLVLGGIAGGALGWLVGAGALAVPGVGPVVALGAIGATVAGAAAGAVAGGVLGLLAGLGVPEEQARTYEAAVKRGAILVSCGCDDEREVRRAREILERHGGGDVRDYDSRQVRAVQRQHIGDEPYTERQSIDARR